MGFNFTNYAYVVTFMIYLFDGYTEILHNCNVCMFIEYE
jgi:hypothetical protein